MTNGELSASRLLTGYLSACGAIFTGALSCSCVQALRGTIPDIQLSVVRSIVQVVLYVTGGKCVGAEFGIKKETIPGLLYLSAAYMAINVGQYGSTAYLPLSEANGILTIGLMITAFLHSRLLYNKDITKSNIVSLTVCLVGVVLTAQPSWMFKQMKTFPNMTSSSLNNVSQDFTLTHMHSSSDSRYSVSKGAITIGYLLSVMGGAGGGVTFDISGIMLQGIKPVVKASYAASFTILGSVVFMFYLEDPVLKMNISQVMLVLGHAVLSAITSFLSIQSGHYVPGPSVSLVFSFEVVTMLIAQYTIMHSVMPGNYNWIEVVGCVTIALGASIPSTLDILAHRAKADELP